MLSATVDVAFQLPSVRPLEKPMAFTGAQLQRLVSWGETHATHRAPALSAIIDRVESLRGSSITWAVGLRLADVVTWSVRNARGSAPNLMAPVTFFKTEHCQWIPKVVIYPILGTHVDSIELTAYHTTCRRGSMECMFISEDHIAGGYLDSKHFKRAFNGAFFCDRQTNTTIFCPTLRDWGFRTWNEGLAMEPTWASTRASGVLR